VRPVFAETIAEAQALSGDRFRIGDTDFQLTDILAPSEYDLHRATQPFFSEARTVLSGLIENETLQITDAGPSTRWGARRVTVRTAGADITLQERLVSAGAARAAPYTDDHDLIEKLLSAEKLARGARRGLWRLHAYRVFDAANAAPALGGYHLVEGTVVRASEARSRFYLNFGADFRSDFTASAQMRDYRRWEKDGLDLAALQGTRVRIRGFVARVNGPSVVLSHPKQIEIVG
jgi:endonuclease YncB( thermonuclease family)